MSLQITRERYFPCRDRMRSLLENCFAVCLYCVTIAWQQIFKDSLMA